MNKCINVLCIAGLIIFVFCLHGCTNVPVSRANINENIWHASARAAEVQACINDTNTLASDIGVDEVVLKNVYWMCLINKGQAL